MRHSRGEYRAVRAKSLWQHVNTEYSKGARWPFRQRERAGWIGREPASPAERKHERREEERRMKRAREASIEAKTRSSGVLRVAAIKRKSEEDRAEREKEGGREPKVRVRSRDVWTRRRRSVTVGIPVRSPVCSRGRRAGSCKIRAKEDRINKRRRREAQQRVLHRKKEDGAEENHMGWRGGSARVRPRARVWHWLEGARTRGIKKYKEWCEGGRYRCVC